MKYRFAFVLVFFLAITAWGQKRFSEGTINYDIVINTGSAKPQAADFFDGATSTIYLKGNKSRTEMVSSLGTQATIIDPAKNSIVILKEYGNQKYLINLTPANWKEVNRRYENITFSYTDSTKKILGYNCRKAIGKLSDGTTFTVWYTPDLVPENKVFQAMNEALPGLAMEYEANMGNLNVTYTVSNISLATVPVARFDLPKAGYRVLSYEESRGKRN